MKKKWTSHIIAVGALVVFVALGLACASKPEQVASSGGMITLDQALKDASTRIDERVAAKTKIAPLNFNSPHDKFSSYVLDEVTANLVDSGKLTVVDRKEVELIRGEFNFQLSGEVGDDSMQQLGRMLGAQSIISGSLTDMGGFYRIVIRVLNVQNASVEVQYRANITSDNVMAALLTGGKTAVAASATQRTPASSTAQAPAAIPVQTTPAPAPKTYNIGDKGPAGGIIFYDKFSTAGGWRYLEAAPKETEQKFPWGDIGLDGTSAALGDGKRNTELIVRKLQEKKIGGAAQYCDDLEYGGYTDWFLPSRDELNLMYQNLKEMKLGDFRNDIYLSSLQSGFQGWYCLGQNFRDGSQNDSTEKKTSFWVRAVRAF
ncbi:CsgG/HfaB family protein [Treponema sp. R80B11-R83G3]